MARGRFRGTFPQRSRRSVTWGVGPGGESSLLVAGSSNAILGSSVVATGTEVTVVRTRGAFSTYLVMAAAAIDGFFYAVGIGVVTAQAFGAGVASLPDPFDDTDWDGWLWHHFGSVFSPTGTIGSSVMEAERLEIDSKGMRKLDANEVLFATISTTEVGTATMRVQLDSRMLFKLA